MKKYVSLHHKKVEITQVWKISSHSVQPCGRKIDTAEFSRSSIRYE